MKSTEFTLFSRKFKPRYLRQKRKSKKSFYFHILRCTSFLMIPVSTMGDEYIDRPKLTEQKKPFEYIVPTPQEGSEQKHIEFSEMLVMMLTVRGSVRTLLFIHNEALLGSCVSGCLFS